MNGTRLSCTLTALVVLTFGGATRAEQGAPTTPDAGAAPMAEASLDDAVEALDSSDAARRLDAARALARHGEAALPHLLRAMQADPVAEVRGWAARSLWEIGADQGRQAVREAARNDPDERVRGLCAMLAGEPGTPSAAPSPDAPPPGASPAAPQLQVQPQYQPAPPMGYQAYPRYAFGATPERRSRGGRIMSIVGWAATGVFYVGSVVVGAALLAEEEDNSYWLLVPLVGPAVYGTYLFVRADDWEWFEPVAVILGLICWADSLLQLAGLSLAIAGHVRTRRDTGAAEQPTARRGAQLSLAFAGPGGPGLTLTGRFH